MDTLIIIIDISLCDVKLIHLVLFACIVAKIKKPRGPSRDCYKKMGNTFVAALQQEHMNDMHGITGEICNAEFRLKAHNKLKKVAPGKTQIAFFESGLLREPGAKCLLVDVKKQSFLTPKEAAEAYPVEAKLCNLLKHPSLGKAEKIWCIELGDRVEVDNIVVLEPLNLWVTPQFLSGTPRFCLREDLNKTITYQGKAVKLEQRGFAAPKE
jgi:hypothetical protein